MPAGSDAVTVFACEGPHSVFCYGTPEEMLHVLADSMCSLGNNNMHVMGQTLVTLNPLNAEEFAKRGWSKQDVRLYLWEHARRPLSDVRACGVVHEQFRKMERDAGRYPLRYDLDNPTTRLPVTSTPEDIHIVVAGGRSYFAAVLPGWGGLAVSRSRVPSSGQSDRRSRMEILVRCGRPQSGAPAQDAPTVTRGRADRARGRQPRHPLHHPPGSAPRRASRRQGRPPRQALGHGAFASRCDRHGGRRSRRHRRNGL